MKKYILILTALALLAAASFPVDLAARGKSYVIGFYNLENLFDTYHDEGKNDYEYLPDGANEWTDAKYQKKLHNMARVIAAMKEDNKQWHAILGVSEIENRHVLEDLVNGKVKLGDPIYSPESAQAEPAAPQAEAEPEEESLESLLKLLEN